MKPITQAIRQFLKLESSAGLLLMAAASLAVIAMNTGMSSVYGGLLQTPVSIQIGALSLDKPLFLWINDGLMAIFFFLVGLEVKREIMRGELSSFDKAALPIFAAVGGMAVPALVFVGINMGSPETMRGWAIPAATDIAFALGILALLGTRAPISLKIFLLAVAIIDDIGAILIIALFYTENLSVNALGLASIGVVALFILNKAGVRKITPYVLIGVFMWVCVLKSGVHATLAGIITALFIPMGEKEEGHGPLHHVEHTLHPWVAFLILPVFAFANAGVSFKGLSLDDLLAPLPLGIALGLFIGKPVGVLALSWLATALKIAHLPADVTWRQMAGVACLTGVGFTMSLFIGGLAFDGPETMNGVRLGVICGSVASGLLGFLLLVVPSRKAASSIDKVAADPSPVAAH